ncbi:MAG: hypothetical protein KA250_02600 [Verrucomicrobiales bacterium]|nr:hypothetical protein [Verrucomicrobiales bacterium]MBP9223432.1 hypothetical protein [Verrucomicrobiales bacterium]HQZ27445.1 hypothetical protein [Verrucomicrobiales bacterium]
MYEKYHITGIKQSYRSDSGPKTILLPVVIIALFGAMLTFYVKTRPGGETVSEPVIEKGISDPDSEVLSSQGSTGTGEESLPIGSPIPVSVSASALPERPIQPKKSEIATAKSDLSGTLPLVQAAGIEEREFTPWMSPLALDTYIRQKNSGFEATFWERGHWIRAVEGRWRDDTHEFRIVIGKNPDPERYGWYYRIDQTEEEFSQSILLREQEGFSLVQSDVYERPDGSKRYQGVWQREFTDPPVANSSGRLRPLDVGTLNFRQ